MPALADIAGFAALIVTHQVIGMLFYGSIAGKAFLRLAYPKLRDVRFALRSPPDPAQLSACRDSACVPPPPPASCSPTAGAMWRPL